VTSDESIMDLLRQAPLSFVGTIQYLGSATMEVPIDQRTAIVYVDRVLHSPDTLRGLSGQHITLQLADAADALEVGSTAAFFVHVQAIGKSAAVAEQVRLPLEDVEPYLQVAADTAEQPFATLQRRVETTDMCEHAVNCDALVLSEVIKLEKAPWTNPVRVSEHDADWWVATLQVYYVEKGQLEPGEVRVCFANSVDIAWRNSPKCRASQGGLWMLHKASPELAHLAPFQILHGEDWQPVQSLDPIREYALRKG
jgi:hypothetical protein